MAEFAAHLNQGTSADRPSIFEVIAQESMTSVLRPAIVYALKVLASSSPDRWGWTWRYADEVYVLIDFLVQNHYMKKYGGSFSEHFYGLKRLASATVPKAFHWESSAAVSGSVNPAYGLSDRHRHLSLLVSVLFPYFKLKIDRLFERLREDSLSGQAMSYLPRRRSYFAQLKSVFISVYPFMHFSWESTLLSYQLLYIFRLCPSHSPLLHVVGLRLQRLTRQDILAHNLQGSVLSLYTAKTWKERIISLPASLSNMFISGLSSSLPLIVFFLKFIEWWYSSEHSGVVAAVTQLPIPPPPPQPKVCTFDGSCEPDQLTYSPISSV